MLPEVYDQFKRPEPELEINSGEEIVEKDGYIPAEVQIEQMRRAGVRLGEYRKELYDYSADEEVPGDAFDAHRFADPVDAAIAMAEVLARGTPAVIEVEKSNEEPEKPKEG